MPAEPIKLRFSLKNFYGLDQNTVILDLDISMENVSQLVLFVFIFPNNIGTKKAAKAAYKKISQSVIYSDLP